ncbi:MAG: glycosyltransferase [Candidatus Magasanikbacteria bacterium]|nr:glycosyltransferase [Candidatus Magasanikbacteria bacterium]
MKKILIIGSYNKEYPRNKVLINTLKDFFDIEEINNKYEKWTRHVFFLKAVLKHRKEKDFLLLLHPARKFVFSLFLSKIFFSGKIIVDAFNSVYDSFIYDRKLASKYSIKAFYYFLSDYLMCRLTDIIFFDTREHKDYFINKFKIKDFKKKVVLPVSVDLNLFEDVPDLSDKGIFPKDKFNIFFYGCYIPLQGIEYIVKAAKILEKEKLMNFVLLGAGQTRKEINALCEKLQSKNITFIDRVPYEDLIKYINASDVCLGIFGDTDKAMRVVPNKVLEYGACKKIVVTGRNKAMERYFEDGRDLLYCNMADEHDLSKKILRVYHDYDSYIKMGDNIYKKIKQNFTKESLAEIINKELT